jgi:predicted short-subunit dehydrogenase-like oxidoreductase (DUF2520 family)
MTQFSISIIGRGRLGGALSRRLRAAGYRLLPTANGDLVFLTVPDAAIRQVAKELAQGRDLSRRAVVHCSGAHPAAWLEAAVLAGASVGVFHPLQTFATPQAPVDGCFCGIEADRTWKPRLFRIARAIGARPFDLHGLNRALYHAAAVMLSNYTLTLVEVGERLLAKAGLDQAHAAAIPLLRGTLRNAQALTPARALTGPIARGDAATIALHVRALAPMPDLLELYRAVGSATLDMARQQRILTEDQTTPARMALFTEV